MPSRPAAEPSDSILSASLRVFLLLIRRYSGINLNLVINVFVFLFFNLEDAAMKKILFFFFICAITSFKPKELTWTAIGDSITYLNEHTNETGSRITKGYMTMVTEKLPNIHYKNQGHNGWTSGGIAKKFDQLNVEKSDVYSVFLGTNDWWQGRPLGSMSDYKNNTGNETVYGSFR